MNPEDDKTGSAAKHNREMLNTKKVRVADTASLNIGMSSQIIDYYNRFGKNRDLEKYLALATSRMCLNTDSNYQHFGDVGISKVPQLAMEPALKQIEVCRLSENCSSEDSSSSSKETSYALDDILESKEDNDEVDDEKNAGTVAVDNDGGKIPPSDTDSPRKSAEQNLDTSLNKPVSPSSSITSRRLEWDSLADVGYNDNGGKTLSTLERMVLHQQYANSGELRNAEDKEIGLPTAQSTPINLLLPSTSAEGRSKTSNKNDGRLKKNMKKTVKINQPIVQEAIGEQFIRENIPGTINVNLTKNISVNIGKQESVNEDNCLRQDGKIIALQLRNISTNTSALANLDKEIQTTLPREISESPKILDSSNENQNINLVEKFTGMKYIPIMLKVGKKSQHISLATRHLKRKKKKQKYKRATEEKPSKSDKSKIAMISEPSTSQQIRNDENELSEAESFEYLPGHMYQRKENSNNGSSEKPMVSTSRTTSLESSGVTSSSQGADQQDSDRSFSKDLRASIALLNKLVEERHKDASLKRRLIKSVIKKLLKTKYRDDVSTPDQSSPKLAENIEGEMKNIASHNDNKENSTSTRDTSEENKLSQHKNAQFKKSILRKRNFGCKTIASPAHSAPDLAVRRDFYDTKKNARSSLSLELEKLLLQSTYRSDASSKSSSEIRTDSNFVHNSSDDKTSPDWLKPVTKSEKLYEQKAKEKLLEAQQESISKSTQSPPFIGDDKGCWVPVLYENKRSEDPNTAPNLLKELSRLPKEIGSGDSKLDSIRSPVGMGNAPRRMHTVFTLANLNYHDAKTEIPSSSGYKRCHDRASPDEELNLRNMQKIDKVKRQEPKESTKNKFDMEYCSCTNDETSNIKKPLDFSKSFTGSDCCNIKKCVLHRREPEQFRQILASDDPKRSLHICDAEGRILANFNDDFIIYKRVNELRLSDESNKKQSNVVYSPESSSEIVSRKEKSRQISDSDLESEKVSLEYINTISKVFDQKSRKLSDVVSYSPERKSRQSRKSEGKTLTPKLEGKKKVAVSVYTEHQEGHSKKSTNKSVDQDMKDYGNMKGNDRRGEDENGKKDYKNDHSHDKDKDKDKRHIKRIEQDIKIDDLSETKNQYFDECVTVTKEIQTRLSINTKALKPTLQDINIDDHGPPCQCVGPTCCAAIIISAKKSNDRQNRLENPKFEYKRRSHSSAVSEPKIVPQIKKNPVISYSSRESTLNEDKYDEIVSSRTNSLSARSKSPTREETSVNRENNTFTKNKKVSKSGENIHVTKSSTKNSDTSSPRTKMLKSRNEIIADVHTMRNHLNKMANHKCSKRKNDRENSVPETCSMGCNTQLHHTEDQTDNIITVGATKLDKSVSAKSDNASSRSIYSPVRSDRRYEKVESSRISEHPEVNYLHSRENSKPTEHDHKCFPNSEYNSEIHNRNNNLIKSQPKSGSSERYHNSASRRTSGSKSGIEYTLSSTSSMTIDSRSVRRPDFSEHNYNEEICNQIVHDERKMLPKSPKKLDKKTHTTKSNYTMTTQNIGTQSVNVDSNNHKKTAKHNSHNEPEVTRESKRIGTDEHHENSVKSEKDKVKSLHNDNQGLLASSSLSYTDSLKNLIEMFQDNEKKLEGSQIRKITPHHKQNDILRQLKFLLSATAVNVETNVINDYQSSKSDRANSHNVNTQTRKKTPQNAANLYKTYETGRSNMYQVHSASIRKDSSEPTSEHLESPMTSHAQKLFQKFKKAYDKLYSQHAHCCHECCKFMQQMHNKSDSCRADRHSQNQSKTCGKCGTQYAKVYHSTDSSTPVCCDHKCISRRRLRRSDNIPKNIKRSVAYNLILEPSSHSVEENAFRKKKTPLKDVFMKIPKNSNGNETFKLNHNQTKDKHMRRCLSNENFQANQDHIFTGNLYSYPTTCNEGFVSSERRSSAPETSTSEPVYKTMSLREYLHQNRPEFVANADKRHDSLKTLHGLRLRQHAAKRLLVSLGAATQEHAQHLSLKDVREVAQQAGLSVPYHYADLEKPIKEKEMKQHSQKIFKQLPEQLQKKEKRKKEIFKQTNRLMASLYRKSLQKKALRGTVTMSHYASIVSL